MTEARISEKSADFVRRLPATGKMRYAGRMPIEPDDSAPPIPPPPRKIDQKEVARKIARFFELHELATELALAGIRHRHPEASPAELRRLLRERLAIFRADKWRRHE